MEFIFPGLRKKRIKYEKWSRRVDNTTHDNKSSRENHKEGEEELE